MSDLFETIPRGILRDQASTQSDHSIRFLSQQFMNPPPFILSLSGCTCVFARKLMRDGEVGRGTLERQRERGRGGTTQEARTGTVMSVYTVS